MGLDGICRYENRTEYFLPKSSPGQGYHHFNIGVKIQNLNKLLFKDPHVTTDKFQFDQLYDDVILILNVQDQNSNQEITKKNIKKIFVGENVLKYHRKFDKYFALCIKSQTMSNLKHIFHNFYRLLDEKRLDNGTKPLEIRVIENYNRTEL